MRFHLQVIDWPEAITFQVSILRDEDSCGELLYPRLLFLRGQRAAAILLTELLDELHKVFQGERQDLNVGHSLQVHVHLIVKEDGTRVNY